MQQTAAIDPEYGTTDKEGPMVNQPRNPAREPCETGKRGEDEDSVEIELPVEPALFVGLFIVFFIAILAFLTIQNVNDPTKTLPDMIRSFITTNTASATLTAIGLSLMAVVTWKTSKPVGSRIRKLLVKLFAKEPSN